MTAWLPCPDCHEGQLFDGRPCPSCRGCGALDPAGPLPVAQSAIEAFKDRPVPVPKRALTLRPHWAEAVCRLGKWVENRPIAPVTLLGERIAIHAGQRSGHHAEADNREAAELGLNLAHCPTGVFVATARVFGYMDDAGGIELCAEMPQSDGAAWLRKAMSSPWWRGGPRGWLLDQVIVLQQPVRERGQLGAWSILYTTLVKLRGAENKALGRCGLGMHADSPAPVQP